MMSMTGHAWREWQDERCSASIEMKSYNNRYLDTSVQVPGWLSPLEPRIRTLLSDAFSRGKIECVIRARSFESELSVRIDERLAEEYANALRSLSRAANMSAEPTLSDITSFEGVVVTEQHVDFEAWWNWLEPKIGDGIANLREARSAEGDKLRRVIERERARIGELVARVSRRAEDLQEHIKANILERVEELGLGSIDDSRVLSETALLLVKYSIREELDRLNAHLDSFDRNASESGGIGKRLDFICQEIGREINTIGSKSVLDDVNAAVVSAKDALENIREQLRNVE
ncbi:MAG: YicC/YloC family endoribonuclease [Spirochaetia bacterium]